MGGATLTARGDSQGEALRKLDEQLEKARQDGLFVEGEVRVELGQDQWVAYGKVHT